MNFNTGRLQTGSDYNRQNIFTSQFKGSLEGGESIDFAKTIKNYRAKALTGMSEDDWEEYKRLCEKYLEDNPVRTEEERNAFIEYCKSILKKLGFKGDINEFLGNYMNMGKMEGESNESVETPMDETNSTDHGNIMDKMREESTRKIITDTDGKKYLLVTIGTKQAFKIRIPDETEQLVEGIENVGNNIIV